MEIRTATGPDGAVLHLLNRPASALPPVNRRDLELAWETARDSTWAAAPPRIFRFAGPAGPAIDLLIADADAAAWAAAVERRFGLNSAHGISLCLRLLAMVALMAHAGWARGWFALERDGANIRPEFLQAAALVPLSNAGGFDETALRALLPNQITRDAK